jgi:hypothetical protein
MTLLQQICKEKAYKVLEFIVNSPKVDPVELVVELFVTISPSEKLTAFQLLPPSIAKSLRPSLIKKVAGCHGDVILALLDMGWVRRVVFFSIFVWTFFFIFFCSDACWFGRA